MSLATVFLFMICTKKGRMYRLQGPPSLLTPTTESFILFFPECCLVVLWLLSRFSLFLWASQFDHDVFRYLFHCLSCVWVTELLVFISLWFHQIWEVAFIKKNFLHILTVFRVTIWFCHTDPWGFVHFPLFLLFFRLSTFTFLLILTNLSFSHFPFGVKSSVN